MTAETAQKHDWSPMMDLRHEVEVIDTEIVRLFARRAENRAKAMRVKLENDLPTQDPARVEDVIAYVRAAAADCGWDADKAERLYRFVIDCSHSDEENQRSQKKQGV